MKKSRKHYTPEEKVAVLRRHLLEKEPISKLCDELGDRRQLDLPTNDSAELLGALPDFAGAAGTTGTESLSTSLSFASAPPGITG